MKVEWCELKAEENLPRRITGVIKAKGGHTKYPICDVSV